MDRVMIAAIKSGSGKTSLTCALAQILKKKGRRVSILKCGPDYIDPMFHRKILGVESDNIDSFFSDEKDCRYIMSAQTGDFILFEGVMGVYDGITGLGSRGSCYETACMTHTPIVLVVDSAGMGYTLISMLEGIVSRDARGLIKGVVFNRISERMYLYYKSEIGTSLILKNINVLGWIPGLDEVKIKSRHLGLVRPEEIHDLKDRISRLSDAVSEGVCIDEIEKTASQAGYLNEKTKSKTIIKRKGLKLAVARDEAFCFYYKRNINCFTDKGIDIVYFSPLSDEKVPEGVDGILLGGGYPELYLKSLSDNNSMKESVRELFDSKIPSLAECGGFMYLLEGIWSDREYSMTGIIQGSAANKKKLVRFGYGTITGNKGIMKGLSVRGHEFHYYDTESVGADCSMIHPGSKKVHKCLHVGKNSIWGFAHLYYASCPELIERFVLEMEEYHG